MMHRATRALVAAAMGALIAAPAVAQTPAPAHQNAQDPNEVICEKQEVVGSRLQKRRVCMTRSQWADARLQDKQALERVQTPVGLKGQ